MPPQTLQTQLSVQQSESPLQLPFVGWQLVIGLHVLLLSQVSLELQHWTPLAQLSPSFAQELAGLHVLLLSHVSLELQHTTPLAQLLPSFAQPAGGWLHVLLLSQMSVESQQTTPLAQLLPSLAQLDEGLHVLVLSHVSLERQQLTPLAQLSPSFAQLLDAGLHVLLLSQVSVERQQGVPSEQLLPSFAHEPPSAAPGWQVSELESQFRPSQQPDPSPQYTFSWLQAPPSADVVEIVVQTPLLGSQLRPSVQHWPRLQS